MEKNASVKEQLLNELEGSICIKCYKYETIIKIAKQLGFYQKCYVINNDEYHVTFVYRGKMEEMLTKAMCLGVFICAISNKIL